MKHNKCQCPEFADATSNEWMYSEEEKSGMNHQPNKCKGTNEIKKWLRDGKELYLCSCCNLFGDELVALSSKKLSNKEGKI